MNKKPLCLLLSLLMLCLSVSAFAAIPSKTTQDMAHVSRIDTKNSVPVGAAFSFSFANAAPATEAERIAVERKLAATQAELSAIYAFSVENQRPVIDYFGDDIKAAAGLLLPEGFDMDTLAMNELVPLMINGYEEAYGDMTVYLEFATQYQPGQPLVALVGVVTGVDEQGQQIVEWVPLQAEATEDGLVKVDFPSDLIMKIQQGDAMLAVLSGDSAR